MSWLSNLTLDCLQREATLWTSGVYLNCLPFPSQKIVFSNQEKAFPKCHELSCTQRGNGERFLKKVLEGWRGS